MTATYERIYGEQAVGQNRDRIIKLENTTPPAGAAELTWISTTVAVDAGGGAADPTFTSDIAEYAILAGSVSDEDTIFYRWEAVVNDPGDGSGTRWGLVLPINGSVWGPSGYGYLIASHTGLPVTRYAFEFQLQGSSASVAFMCTEGIEPDAGITDTYSVCAIRPDFPFTIDTGDQIGGMVIYKTFQPL